MNEKLEQLRNRREKERHEKLEQLRNLREEERHEIGWIAHRLGWFLAVESFLLTAAIMSHSHDYEWWYGTVATLVLGLFGVVLAARAHLAVKAAQAVINGWLVLEHDLCPKDDQDSRRDWGYYRRLPRPVHLAGDYKKDFLHTVAVKYHLKLPMAVVYAWIFVFAVAVVHSASTMPACLIFTPTDPQVVFVSLAAALLECAILGLLVYFRRDSTSVRKGSDELRTHDKLPTKTRNPSHS